MIKLRKILIESNTDNFFDFYDGAPIIPNKYVYHVSNPKNRNSIMKKGLIAQVGEQRYDYYMGEYEPKDIPAIFATNSDNKKDWFNSTYDDDIWRIDTKNLSNKWFKDINFDDDYHHIITFTDIPKTAIKLIYKGTGDSE